MVDGSRPSDIAIERIDWLATTARDISSRSAKLSANRERLRGTGRIPPVSARMRYIAMDGFDQTTGQSDEGNLPLASAPTSVLSDFLCNRSSFGISSTTSSSIFKRIECCVDQLKPQSKAAIYKL
jgi:hypothetical protein